MPAEARIKVDVRVQERGEKERVEAAMAALTTVDPDATIEVTGCDQPSADAGVGIGARCSRWRLRHRPVGRRASPSAGAATATSPRPSGCRRSTASARSAAAPTPIDEYVEVATIPGRIRLLAGLLRQLCGDATRPPT